MTTYRQLVPASTLMLGAVISCPNQPEATYFFDCLGWIQRIDRGVAITPAKHVAEIDSTLPARVRDGCSIHAGWRDGARDRLVLLVQTQPLQDEHGELPTKLLTLATPGLVPLATDEQSVRPPRRPSSQVVRTSLRSIANPFARSMGYVLSDGTTLLLQELANGTPTAQPLQLAPLWQPGTVSHNRAYAEATGRYALFDITTRVQLGVVISTTLARHDHRVVCFTPSGRIYLAAARDTLLSLDVMEPARHSIIGDVALDLHWTACA